MGARMQTLLCAAAVAASYAVAAQNVRTVNCDIIVAGGSLASAAAALTAANTTADTVCFLEITDWPGGQATASGTSAIDFGANWDAFPANVPASFGDMLLSPLFGNASNNPGGCTVSRKCFPPVWAVNWILEAAAALPNLKVFLNTAVVGATLAPGPGGGGVPVMTSITGVQRTPTPAHPSGWDRNLSAALPDWYSPTPSEWFTKQVLNFSLANAKGGGVVIEATEFGDVLMTANLSVAQGMEVPVENTTAYDDVCGQAATMVFWASYSDALAPSPDPAPQGSDEGYPLPGDLDNPSNLLHALVWRRNWAVNRSDTGSVRQGDMLMINEQSGNDLLNAQVFLPLAVARQQAAAGTWAGGMNLTALAMAEQRAFNYYQELKNATVRVYPAAAPYFQLNYTAAGTLTGLAKMPYLRESRRAQYGINQFRLCSAFAAVNGTGPGGPGCWEPAMDPAPAPDSESDSEAASGSGAAQQVQVQGNKGFKWVDTVGIGSYGFDIHHFNADYCTYPAYLNYSPDPGPALPYYLPWRAHTHAEVSNLLVAGKSMAQTFLANAVTRLHPTEWVSGTAAGAAASLMIAHGWSSSDVYVNRALLQDLLTSDAVRTPLEWA